MIIFYHSAIIAGNPRFYSRIKVRGSKTTSSEGPRIWAKKNLTILFSKARILARKKADFSTFRTVNDHFWSIGDHRWKSSFLVPDQSSGVQNDQLGLVS